MAEMVHGVAVQVDEAPALHILQPDALGRPQRGEAGAGTVLVEEGRGIAGDKIVHGRTMARSADIASRRRRLSLRFSTSQASPIASSAKPSNARLLAAA